MQRVLPVLLVVCAAMAGGAVHAADVVAVLGTGRVGAALGPQFARQGMRVIYGSREPDRAQVLALVKSTAHGASAATSAVAVRDANIVVLALPWNATEATVRGLDLADKIVIDPTNAVKMGESHLLEMAVDTSAAELIQSWAPRARVVKAFNTIGFHVMADSQAAGGPVTVPLAGDDDAAKAKVAKIVAAMGLESVDVGPLRHARVLEAMVIVYMYPYMSGHRDQAFEFHFRKGAAPKQRGVVRPAQ